ncbi:hypothetical protein [Massilia sp. YIM B04103]|uniref:hypothetical protein n=1 Tax=Massilia sp. YIM B04103 TaxID=2963106 RepID=UPI0021088CC1|nr:hypothetical protein [Massilia sp. YIM B04103]
MKTINKTFGESMREIGDAFSGFARHCQRALARMSWPSLLGMCVVLALLITILPLALMLFACFLLLKLLVGKNPPPTRHFPRQPHQQQPHEGSN